MNYNLLCKSIIRFHIGMGIYGFTRGFRTNYDHSLSRFISKDESQRKLLLSERLFEGSINAMIYLAPIYNIYPLFCLSNRIEISIRGLKKDDYINYYREPFSGYCFDTL